MGDLSKQIAIKNPAKVGVWVDTKTIVIKKSCKGGSMGGRPKWRMTKMEDDQHGRRPKWKTTKMEYGQNGRRPKWKMTKMEDDQNGTRPKSKTILHHPLDTRITSCLVDTEILRRG